MAMPTVREQEKELRFTRSGQAVVFWLLAAMCAMAAVTLVAASVHRHENPALPHAAWAVIPLTAAFGLARLALWLTRHAYLILTPLGIDIFPFFRPADGMRTVFWSEVHSFELEGLMATLHFNEQKTAGVRLSLRPVAHGKRSLLIHAMEARAKIRSGAC